MLEAPIIWLVIAAGQLAAVVLVGVQVRRRPTAALRVVGALLVVIGIAIGIATFAWVLAGGPDGSPDNLAHRKGGETPRG